MPPVTCAFSTSSRRSSTSGWLARIAPRLPKPASTSFPPVLCSTSPVGLSRTFSRTMADADTRERIVKQRWAEPGSGHDRIVRWTKILLPSAVGVLIAVLALAPLDKKGDVSFILDKKKVQSAPGRIGVEAGRYNGTDDKGQLFEI